MGVMRSSNGKATDARTKLAANAEPEPLITLQIPESLSVQKHTFRSLAQRIYKQDDHVIYHPNREIFEMKGMLKIGQGHSVIGNDINEQTRTCRHSP